MSATLERLARLLAVVPWLLEHPGTDVGVISERLGVPREDLLADLDLLGYCGLPGYGGGDLIEVSIIGDHVTLRMADYFRRPLRLSLREAVTLLLAARALGGVEGLPESGPLRAAAARLERALGATGGAAGTGADGDLRPTARLAVQLGDAGEEHLALLRTALRSGRAVQIVYRSDSRSATSEREVDPWSLTAAGGSWYLQGWCRSAAGPRDFRLDRIREATLSGPARRPVPPDLPSPVYRPEPDDPEVVLDCDPTVAWLAEWVKAEMVEESHDGRRRVTLQVDHLEWAARLVLRLEGHAVVQAPQALAERVNALAVTALHQYDDPHHAPTDV